jgi:hypothetical protein
MSPLLFFSKFQEIDGLLSVTRIMKSWKECSVSFLVPNYGGFVEGEELVGVVDHVAEGHC